jgi:hypothetical protein
MHTLGDGKMSEQMFKFGWRFDIPELYGYTEKEVDEMLRPVVPNMAAINCIDDDEENIYYDYKDGDDLIHRSNNGTIWLLHIIRECPVYEIGGLYIDVDDHDDSWCDTYEVVFKHIKELGIECGDEMSDVQWFAHGWYNGTDDPIEYW